MLMVLARVAREEEFFRKTSISRRTRRFSDEYDRKAKNGY